jgi:hypothetical protein
VWAGADISPLHGGGLYDPASNTWTATSTTGEPAARYLHAAVWSGGELIVWGGFSTVPLADGGRFDPAANAWSGLGAAAPLAARYNHTMVWTGDRMIVWGGMGAAELGDGAAYDPALRQWTPLASSGAPSPRARHSAVFADGKMLVWGGEAASEALDSGARYDPALNAWQSMTAASRPAARFGHQAVVAAPLMILWGGDNGISVLASGGRYLFRQVIDADGDGRTCDLDCDDANASAWSAPGEVPSLTVTQAGGPGTAALLTWGAPSDAGGAAAALLYDVLRSDVPGDFTSAALCLESDAGGGTAGDPALPAVGAAFHYLVRALSQCPAGAGQGSLGSDSNGVARVGRACP